MLIKQIPVQVMYKKDNGMFVFNLNELPPVEGFTLTERVGIVIPPDIIGGNHRHLRQEAFIAMHPGLQIYWLELDGVRQTLPLMGKNQELFLTLVPSMVPHAVKNTSEKEHAALIEYSNMKSSKVERIMVLEA